MKFLLATANKAKIKSYGSKLQKLGFDFVTLKDLNLNHYVEETGNTPVENAIIKAKEYNKISSLPAIAIDDGLYLENVPDNLQPGVNVRRVNGKRLNDSEMIEHYVNMVNTYGNNGILKGYFLKGIAICTGNKTFTFESKANRNFTNKQSYVISDGYPLESIQIVPELNKFKSELTLEEKEQTMAADQKEILEFLAETLKRLN